MTLRQIEKARRRLALKRNVSRALWTPLVLACLAVSIYGAWGVLSYAVPWLEANRVQSRFLADLEPPVLVTAVISYDREPPKNISIRHLETGETVKGLEILPGQTENAVAVRFELSPDMPAGGYGVSLSPGGNHRIGLASEALPSYRYVGLDVARWTGRTGKRWIGLVPDYAYAAGDGRIRVLISADDGSPVYAGYAASGGTVDLCVDALLPGASGLVIELSAGYEDPYAEPGSLSAASYRTARGRYETEDGPWPESPCPAGHSEDMAATDAYLASLGGGKSTTKES